MPKHGVHSKRVKYTEIYSPRYDVTYQVGLNNIVALIMFNIGSNSHARANRTKKGAIATEVETCDEPLGVEPVACRKHVNIYVPRTAACANVRHTQPHLLEITH